MTLDAPAAAELVRSTLGAAPEVVEHIPTLEDTTVFRLVVSGRQAYLKSAPGEDIPMHAWAYTRAASVGVPVPEVLARGEAGAGWPEPWFITTAAEGVCLADTGLDRDATDRAVARTGELLRMLHTVQLDGFGYFRPSATWAPDPSGSADDWGRCVRNGRTWGLSYLAQHALLDPGTIEAVDEIHERHHELIGGCDRAAFIHGDIGPDHIFVDAATADVTGLIDFEPAAADPLVDLGTFAFHHPHLLQPLLDGYGPLPPDGQMRIDVYALTRGVGATRWYHERGIDVTHDLRVITLEAARLRACLP